MTPRAVPSSYSHDDYEDSSYEDGNDISSDSSAYSDRNFDHIDISNCFHLSFILYFYIQPIQYPLCQFSKHCELIQLDLATFLSKCGMKCPNSKVIYIYINASFVIISFYNIIDGFLDKSANFILSLVMIAVGLMYRNECQAEPMLPLFLIFLGIK